MPRYGLIYAGAQKNLGPSGVTLVIIREDLLARSPSTLPTMLNYKVQAENNSLYNTPHDFGIYILGLDDEVAAGRWAGSTAIAGATSARRRSCTPRSIGPASTAARRAEGQPVADERHLPAAERGAGEDVRQGGHRGRSRRPEGPPLGGRHARVDLQRVPEEGVDALVEFMREFERTHG